MSLNMFFKVQIMFVTCLTILSAASGSRQNENFPNYFYAENVIDESDFGPRKTSAESTVAQFRSLVDPGDRYGDIWEAVGREARSNDLTDMAYEVFKEMLSEFLFGTVGSFFGIENRRTENVGMFERIIGAIRKHTIHKKMGCP